MFKRIKVITLLISVLLVLGIMQVISAGIFINALNNDKDNFTVSQLSSKNVAEFTDAWISLNQARVTLNRGMLRLQSSMASQINGGQLNELVNTAKNLLAEAQVHYDKYYALPNTPGLDENLANRLEEQYRIYSATLTQMNVLLSQGNLEDMFKQNAEQKQNAMQTVYREWREAQAALTDKGIQDNESDYKRILWILSAVMLLVIVVIISSWVAMRRVLLLPLEEVINHIRAIAAGDLTQPIQADGNNEMAIWRATCRRCKPRWRTPWAWCEKGPIPFTLVPVKFLPAVTISLPVPNSRLLPRRDGSQHGTADGNREAERR